MDVVRRNFRVDGVLADHLTEYSRYSICTESTIVNVALAYLFANGREYVADLVEHYNHCDDSQDFIALCLYGVI